MKNKSTELKKITLHSQVNDKRLLDTLLEDYIFLLSITMKSLMEMENIILQELLYLYVQNR